MKPCSLSHWFGGCRRLITAGLCLLPSLAFAHPGHFHPGEDDEFNSMAAGFLHPFSGVDHMALALAAGWFAFALGGRKPLVPVGAFLSALLAGAIVGRGFSEGTGLEVSLAATLIAAGFSLLSLRTPKWGGLSAGAALVGFVHGLAHGSQIGAGPSFVPGVAGVLLGTAVLLGAGGLMKRASALAPCPRVPRVVGAALLAMGSISLIHAL